MKSALLSRLRCPQSQQELCLDSEANPKAPEGWLVSADSRFHYPIRGSIPRFVPESNYADNFGLQWNRFAKTQLDSYSGHPISANRFWETTCWSPAEMRNKWVLDAGCGSGRFAEIALSTGATVVALDYSSAVDACWSNLKHHPKLHVIQANIYALPFKPKSFDFIYSLGVLQHTPDVARAFAALPPMLAPNGRICVDYYEKSLKSMLLPKYWLRPFTKLLPKQKLFALLEKLVPRLLIVSCLFGRTPALGKFLKRLIPVANYDGLLPLSKTALTEWALLDTFDWFSPAYDNPQTKKTVRRYMERARLEDVWVLKAGHLVARGRKPCH